MSVGLQRLARGNLSGTGETNVYLAGCAQAGPYFVGVEPGSEALGQLLGFEFFRDKIVDTLLASTDCCIWFTDDEPAPDELDAHLRQLEKMDCMVLLVNNAILQHPGPVLEAEIRRAKELGLPIMPIVPHKSFAERFENWMGRKQFLPYVDDDETAEPFKRRLEDFFNTFVGRQLHRGGFAVRAFVSYRKKDRELLRELLATIHAEPRHRRIATWFDERLVAGESYEQTIDDELVACDFVLLMVTPSLLEQGNYVMRVEYKRACETGRRILPVLMADTELDALQECYPGLPPLVDGHDSQQLHAALDALCGDALRTQPTPEQLNHLARAFYRGTCVEKNIQYGREYLEQAALAGNIDAAGDLVMLAMMRESEFGRGSAARWLDVYEELLASKGTQCSFDESKRYLDLSLLVCDSLISAGRLQEALTRSLQRIPMAYEAAALLDDKDQATCLVADAQSYQGEVLLAMQDYQGAEQLFQKAYVDLWERIKQYQQPNHLQFEDVPSLLLQSLTNALGPLRTVEMELGNRGLEIAYYRTCLEAIQTLRERDGSIGCEISLLQLLEAEAQSRESHGELAEAAEVYRDIADHAKYLIDTHVNEVGLLRIRADACTWLARHAEKDVALDQRKNLWKEAMEANEELLRIELTPVNQRYYCESVIRLGDAAYEQALDLSEAARTDEEAEFTRDRVVNEAYDNLRWAAGFLAKRLDAPSDADASTNDAGTVAAADDPTLRRLLRDAYHGLAKVYIDCGDTLTADYRESIDADDEAAYRRWQLERAHEYLLHARSQMGFDTGRLDDLAQHYYIMGDMARIAQLFDDARLFFESTLEMLRIEALMAQMEPTRKYLQDVAMSYGVLRQNALTMRADTVLQQADMIVLELFRYIRQLPQDSLNIPDELTAVVQQALDDLG